MLPEEEEVVVPEVPLVPDVPPEEVDVVVPPDVVPLVPDDPPEEVVVPELPLEVVVPPLEVQLGVGFWNKPDSAR